MTLHSSFQIGGGDICQPGPGGSVTSVGVQADISHQTTDDNIDTEMGPRQQMEKALKTLDMMDESDADSAFEFDM